MDRLPHRHLTTLRLDVDFRHVVTIGATPAGHRSIAPVTGGRFDGERLSGSVLPGGNDWVTARSDGSMAIDVRLTLLTHDEVPIYLVYCGVLRIAPGAIGRFRSGEQLVPEDYALRIAARFECGHERYRWLNDVLAVSSGEQTPAGPIYRMFEIG